MPSVYISLSSFFPFCSTLSQLDGGAAAVEEEGKKVTSVYFRFS
jgi:hypothetical protein